MVDVLQCIGVVIWKMIVMMDLMKSTVPTFPATLLPLVRVSLYRFMSMCGCEHIYYIPLFTLASSFHCPGTANTCIPAKWQCDGEKDCPEGKDEISCEIPNCETWQFEVYIYYHFFSILDSE